MQLRTFTQAPNVFKKRSLLGDSETLNAYEKEQERKRIEKELASQVKVIHKINRDYK